MMIFVYWRSELRLQDFIDDITGPAQIPQDWNNTLLHMHPFNAIIVRVSSYSILWIWVLNHHLFPYVSRKAPLSKQKQSFENWFYSETSSWDIYREFSCLLTAHEQPIRRDLCSHILYSVTGGTYSSLKLGTKSFRNLGKITNQRTKQKYVFSKLLLKDSNTAWGSFFSKRSHLLDWFAWARGAELLLELSFRKEVFRWSF